MPHIAGRPVTRKRWPNGVHEPSFFEKQLAAPRPDWLERGTIVAQVGHHHLSDHRHRRGPGLDRAAGRAGSPCAAMAFRRRTSPGPATRWCSTWTPGGRRCRQLCEVAHAVRDLIERHRPDDLSAHQRQQGHASLRAARATGQLARRVDGGQTGGAATGTAMPKLVTATMTKSLRAGKVFLDWSQNNAPRPPSRRIRFAAGNIRPSPRRAPGRRSRIPNLRHLRFDEVLRAGRRSDGDLLAAGRRRCRARTG